ncbi:MAG TPA: hypothetical protein VGK90_02270 [Rhizomicrobium sp.]|jgi:hypothetical protein
MTDDHFVQRVMSLAKSTAAVPPDDIAKAQERIDIQLAYLRSHEKHMRYIYGVRFAGLGISALTIIVGAIMIFSGLQGSFNWAVEAPHTLGAKLTNASPGIVFSTIGMIIAFIVIVQKPVAYDTRTPDGARITKAWAAFD